MSLPDLTSSAYLEAEDLYFCHLGFFDFDGDPLRYTNAPYNVGFSGASDTDLNGDYFTISHELVTISAIEHTSENSNTVQATLSGLINYDAALMTLLGDKANWTGRKAILWNILFDKNGQQVGTPWRFYTGRMVNVSYGGTKAASAISVQVENYLAVLSEPSNRSYLAQQDFDPLDLSAAASISAANTRNPNGGNESEEAKKAGLMETIKRIATGNA